MAAPLEQLRKEISRLTEALESRAQLTPQQKVELKAKKFQVDGIFDQVKTSVTNLEEENKQLKEAVITSACECNEASRGSAATLHIARVREFQQQIDTLKMRAETTLATSAQYYNHNNELRKLNQKLEQERNFYRQQVADEIARRRRTQCRMCSLVAQGN